MERKGRRGCRWGGEEREGGREGRRRRGKGGKEEREGEGDGGGEESEGEEEEERVEVGRKREGKVIVSIADFHSPSK